MRRPVTPLDVDAPRRLTRRPSGSIITTTVLVGAAAIVLTAGCTATEPTPSASPRPTSSASASATSTVEPSPTPAPVLVPGGTANENLPFFTLVVGQVWAGADNARGGAYIDALSAAGFDRATMQLTSDTTTIGQPAESIQFSVAWRDACLIGQVGPATGNPVTTVLPLLAGGRCLIGNTVSVG